MKSLEDFINESLVNEASVSAIRKMWTNELGIELPKKDTIYTALDQKEASIKDAQAWWDKFMKANNIELVQKSKTLKDSIFQLENSWIISNGMTVKSVEEYQFNSQLNNRPFAVSVQKVEEDSLTYITLKQIFPNDAKWGAKIWKELGL